MNAETILDHIMALVTPSIHKTRRAAVKACIKSLMHGASGSVTNIGRGIHSSAYEKHNIKRADRLLSNTHLQSELPLIYSSMCKLVENVSSTPIIHIDWSDLDPNKRHFLIRAALIFSGRSLTLYEEVHCMKTKEKPSTHQQFLNRLKEMLGEQVRPIIVTDAGFKVPWFRQVLALGWDYVGRARKPNFYQTADNDWQCISLLYKQASRKAKAISAQLSRSNTLSTTLVLFKGKSKGRSSINCFGQKRQNSNTKKYAKGAADPWLIATSLPQCSGVAKRVIKIYYSRMQIEEAFRDMKSPQYGLGFMVNKSKQIKRIKVLVMLVSLANSILILLGLALVVSGQSSRFQANTVKNRRVLSFHTLGLRAVKQLWFNVTNNQWRTTIRHLINYVRNIDYAIELICGDPSGSDTH